MTEAGDPLEAPVVRGLLPRPAGNWGVLWGPEGQEEVGSHSQGRRCREGPWQGWESKADLVAGGCGKKVGKEGMWEEWGSLLSVSPAPRLPLSSLLKHLLEGHANQAHLENNLYFASP